MSAYKYIHAERTGGCRQQTQKDVFGVQICGQFPSGVTAWHSEGLSMLIHSCSSIDIFVWK